MSGWLDALLGRVRSAGTDVALGYGLDFKTGLRARLNTSTKFIDVEIQDDTLLSSQLAPQGPTGVAVPFVISKPFTALTPGTGDAVAVIDSDQPEIEVLDAWVEITTAILTTAVRLHDTASGATVTYSGTLSSAVTGVVRNSGPRDTATVPAGGPVFLRRSDRGVAGTVHLLCVRK
jgi:hypothetical protein